MPKTIDLFMWSYQTHFRALTEYLAKEVIEIIGAEIDPKGFLVGVRRSNLPNGHQVCIEPEDGERKVSKFEGLIECRGSM